MIVLIFFAALWYVSLFFQTFFNHRYAAHAMFKMGPGTEKVFFVLSWIASGVSYLSPRTYGIMHRMHHAYADTENDPHSPSYSKNLFDMMWKTKERFFNIETGIEKVDPKYMKNLPQWDKFDKFASSWPSRIFWIAIYTTIFALFATHWWMFLLLPLTFIMAPMHGAIINWFAHKVGYRNFEVGDTSMNLMPVDILMLGEGFHNNHHKYGSRANFGVRWFEFDPIYPIIRLLDFLGVIKMETKKEIRNVWDMRLSRSAGRQLQEAFDLAYLEVDKYSDIVPEVKFKLLMKSWEASVNADWTENATEYMKSIRIREKLNNFLKSTRKSLRQKINVKIAPLERLIDEKLLSMGAGLSGI